MKKWHSWCVCMQSEIFDHSIPNSMFFIFSDCHGFRLQFEIHNTLTRKNQRFQMSKIQISSLYILPSTSFFKILKQTKQLPLLPTTFNGHGFGLGPFHPLLYRPFLHCPFHPGCLGPVQSWQPSAFLWGHCILHHSWLWLQRLAPSSWVGGDCPSRRYHPASYYFAELLL